MTAEQDKPEIITDEFGKIWWKSRDTLLGFPVLYGPFNSIQEAEQAAAPKEMKDSGTIDNAADMKRCTKILSRINAILVRWKQPELYARYFRSLWSDN
jgi:hypothetical protein